jgi:DNA-binding FrmR family transcriptional regulator
MGDATRSSCLKRLSRIEGQVRGLSRMVEADRYCIDIITQISAVRAALRRVEEEVLRDHIGHCVKRAMQSGDAGHQDRTIDGLIRVLAQSGG